MTQKVLKVDGMTCDHCVETVTKAVNGLESVKSVRVDLNKKEVTVEFNETKTPLDKISSAITDVGFEVIK